MAAGWCRSFRAAAGFFLSATAPLRRRFRGHFDFELRDQERRFGMIPDGYPRRVVLDRIGVR